MRRGLEEHKPIAIGKLLALLIADLPFIFQVDLVPDQDNLDLIMAMILDLVEPATDVLEGVAFCDVVD